MDIEKKLQAATEQFQKVMRSQLERVERMKNGEDFVDFEKLDKVIIGVCGGDGIGPIISKEAARVVEYLLKDEVAAGKVEIRYIDGLTIENRVACMKAIPDDVLAELKKCHVILKGPTTTPR
ncbi:MAG: isocitrate/isopropylmalate dehydrogenase family protein, partial [Clostridia bacterium]|nr:isocitrate/isopropylmalate dehydrogenase family protein [Clostridia bacterium]